MARDPLDERNFYRRWAGKRTRMADVLTSEEVGMLEDVVAPFQTGPDYFGPVLGSRHVYRKVPTGPKMHGGKEMSDAMIERARQEELEARRAGREAYWAERARIHAQAMALDQEKREKTRYHKAPEDMQAGLRPTRRPIRLTVCCDNCGHRGDLILPRHRITRLRLRCSCCDEPQEL